MPLLRAHHSSLSRETYAEDAPELAPIYHRYGRALLEHAIATSGALGGGGGGSGPAGPAQASLPDRKASSKAASSSKHKTEQAQNGSSNNARFSFGGDGPESDEEGGEDAADAPPAAQEEGGAEEEEEEEDDLSVAFSVLELARLRYENLVGRGEGASLNTLEGEQWGFLRIKAELAEVLNDLADVGLETGELGVWRVH